jgi:hypothetical protein
MLSVGLVVLFLGICLVSPQWFLVRAAGVFLSVSKTLVKWSEAMDSHFLKEYETIRSKYEQEKGI